jgi:hypothetical protein
MEGCSENVPLAYNNGPAFEFRKDLDVRTGSDDNRRPDEHCAHRFAVQSVHRKVRFKAFYLATVCVSDNGDVHDSDPILVAILDLFREKDCTCTRAQYRHPGAHPFTDRLHETEPYQQFPYGSAFPARNDESVYCGKLVSPAHIADVFAHCQEKLIVLLKVALK